MKLLVDIGNTATKFATVNNDKLSFVGRLYNSKVSLENIKSVLSDVKAVRNIYVSSVAPIVYSSVKDILFNLYQVEVKEITNIVDSGVSINIDNKDELGIDLLCDIVAAINLYGNKLAVVDFGTATKILFIDEDKVFSSCAIFLGYSESKRILAKSTELLPNVSDIEIKPISECHNTIDVINSSAYYSQILTVKGLIEKYEQEVGYSLNVIYTGGNASNFKSELTDATYDQDLLLKGLNILSERI